MRPDKPGWWWYLRSLAPCEAVVEIDCDMDVFYEGGLEYIEDFEGDVTFKRWLGQAHPPKEVQRYAFNEDDCFMEGDCEWYVDYEDVKEYLKKDGI